MRFKCNNCQYVYTIGQYLDLPKLTKVQRGIFPDKHLFRQCVICSEVGSFVGVFDEKEGVNDVSK